MWLRYDTNTILVTLHRNQAAVEQDRIRMRAKVNSTGNNATKITEEGRKRKDSNSKTTTQRDV